MIENDKVATSGEFPWLGDPKKAAALGALAVFVTSASAVGIVIGRSLARNAEAPKRDDENDSSSGGAS